MSTQTISLDWLTITMSPRLKYEGDKYGINGEVIHCQKERYMDELYNVDWTTTAEKYIKQISLLLNLEFTQDKHNSLAKLGYTQTLQSGKILLGYHERYEYMGICIQLTGDGLRQYRMSSPYDCPEPWLMRALDNLSDSWEYSCGATRIDIAIDTYNGDTTIRELIDLYHKPNAERQNRYLYTAMEKEDHREIRVRHRSGTQIIDNAEGGTSLYIGSMQSNCRLNIYDKTAERKKACERKKAYERTAADYEIPENWVRYEGRFRGEYARQLFNTLKTFSDYAQYGKYLYRVIDSKWEFRLSEDPDDLHPISKDWKERSKGVLGILKADDRRVSTMQTSYDHITNRSGLFSYLRKAELLYGEDIVPIIMEDLLFEYMQYKTTPDVNNFVDSNKEYYQRDGKRIESGRLYNDAKLPSSIIRRTMFHGMDIPEIIGSENNDNPGSLADVTPSADGSGFLNPKGLTEADE